MNEKCKPKICQIFNIIFPINYTYIMVEDKCIYCQNSESFNINCRIVTNCTNVKTGIKCNYHPLSNKQFLCENISSSKGSHGRKPTSSYEEDYPHDKATTTKLMVGGASSVGWAWPIVGGVSCLLLLAAILGAIFICCRRRRKKKPINVVYEEPSYGSVPESWDDIGRNQTGKPINAVYEEPPHCDETASTLQPISHQLDAECSEIHTRSKSSRDKPKAVYTQVLPKDKRVTVLAITRDAAQDDATRCDVTRDVVTRRGVITDDVVDDDVIYSNEGEEIRPDLDAVVSSGYDARLERVGSVSALNYDTVKPISASVYENQGSLGLEVCPDDDEMPDDIYENEGQLKPTRGLLKTQFSTNRDFASNDESMDTILLENEVYARKLGAY